MPIDRPREGDAPRVEFYSPKQAAEELGLTRSGLRTVVNHGLLLSLRLRWPKARLNAPTEHRQGGDNRFPKDYVDAAVAAVKAEPRKGARSSAEKLEEFAHQSGDMVDNILTNFHIAAHATAKVAGKGGFIPAPAASDLLGMDSRYFSDAPELYTPRKGIRVERLLQAVEWQHLLLPPHTHGFHPPVPRLDNPRRNDERP